jgi:hypothetical protein
MKVPFLATAPFLFLGEQFRYISRCKLRVARDLADRRRRSGYCRGGPFDKKLRERLRQHAPEDRVGAVRLRLAAATHRLPEARQVSIVSLNLIITEQCFLIASEPL